MKGTLLLAVFFLISVSALRNDTALKLMLNQMQYLFDGKGAQFNPSYYKKLVGHMSDRLLESQNKGWQGFIDYFDSNGTDTDRWGSCKTLPYCWNYMDYNPTRLLYHNVLIYEPCNYVSNVAYYHVFTSLADHSNWNIDPDNLQALLNGFATLSFGSAFYHASRTYLGNACDNNLITAIFYPLYQASLKNLDVPRQVREVSATPRSKSALEVSEGLLTLFTSQPPSEWITPIRNIEAPDYWLTAPCIVALLFTLTIPNQIVDAFLAFALTNFKISKFFQQFIFKKYIPALRKATAHLNITISAQIKLFFRMISSVAKMFYASVFQENLLPIEFFKEPWVNAIGALLMPTFNQFISIITGFKYTDFNLENSINVYPGDSTCRVEQPHSKWHEESSSMLLDLVFTVDYIIELTQ